MPKKEPHRPKNESEWLARQAEWTWSAVKGSLKELRPKKVGQLGLSSVTQKHPISSTGIAFAAGLVLTVSWPQSSTKVVRVPGDTLDPWSTLLETGSEILKAVLTPYLQQKLMGSGGPTATVSDPSSAIPE